MSDDTPTQRFDAAGDAPSERVTPAGGDAPTERLATPVTAPIAAEPRDSRRTLIILASIGGALLLAVLIVLIVLLTRGNATPGTLPTASSSPTASATPTTSASPTPSPAPTQNTPAPTPTPTSDSTGLEITEFGAAAASKCVNGEAALTITWESQNGAAAYIGVNTNDAQTSGQGWDLPPSGDQSDFPFPLNFQCGNDSLTYTITIVGTDGTNQSKKVTVQNPGT